jgi:hypothetical protein
MRDTKPIEKLEIDMFDDVDLSKYEAAKAEYVSGYTVYEPGYRTGFFGGWRGGRRVPRPDVGEAKWAELYPEGYEGWAREQNRLNAQGEQNVIDKVNELVEAVNTLHQHPELLTEGKR